MEVRQPAWQRILLLFVMGYEGLGALLGGTLLILEPDGRLMDMPVDMMHGTFPDFLVPGILLLGLGILSVPCFISVVRRKPNDWFMAFLLLGGFFVWFTVEIIILRGVHWLHLMWAWPVLAGLLAAFPLGALRKPGAVHLYLLLGFFSSAWYVLINWIVPYAYAGYSHVTYTVSELSAIGAPSRWLWVVMSTLWVVMLTAFGWGLRFASGGNRRLKILGSLFLVYCVFNFFWPPMHMRGMETSLTDTLHIVWAALTILFMTAMMLTGAGLRGRKFRIYTYVSLALLIVFGALTSTEAPNIPVGDPTPMIGAWERVNIALFMSWVAVLSLSLKNSTYNRGLLEKISPQRRASTKLRARKGAESY